MEAEFHQNKKEKVKKDEDVRYRNRVDSEEQIEVNSRIIALQTQSAISPHTGRRMEGHKDVAKKKMELIRLLDVLDHL